MKKKLLSAIFLSFSLVALAACGSDDTAKEPATEDTDTVHPETEKVQKEETVEPTGNVVEVTIHATNFEFDKKEIKANVGDTIKLTVVNDSGAHGVGIDGYDVEVTGGETVEFVADKAGEFEYYCSVMCGTGHDSMTGTLIVS
ncbi:hypothetical protein ACFOZY_15060 [Chungangia koreensis]|uniref:Cytochrome c oxidase subunit 2 n=1 Tax=Chungangia koreensis TaxID=752657 RepID=A0ABV8XC23_9LACT